MTMKGQISFICGAVGLVWAYGAVRVWTRADFRYAAIGRLKVLA